MSTVHRLSTTGIHSSSPHDIITSPHLASPTSSLAQLAKTTTCPHSFGHSNVLGHLLALGGRLSLRPQVGRGGTSLEVAGEGGLEEGAEDDLGTAGLGKSHPEDEDELEGVVEGEPVDGVDQALKDNQECVGNPVSQPLCIIGLARAEKSLERKVARDDKSGNVDEELGADVEKDEEEV